MRDRPARPIYRTRYTRRGIPQCSLQSRRLFAREALVGRGLRRCPPLHPLSIGSLVLARVLFPSPSALVVLTEGQCVAENLSASEIFRSTEVRRDGSVPVEAR